MRYLLSLFGLFCFFNSSAQYVYKIKADSVKITNDSCTAELILENSTKAVKGFLYNKGNGRTEFRKALQKISDTSYVIGGDTLTLRAGSTGTPLSSILSAAANNTINNQGYTQEWKWDNLGAAKGLSLTANTTGAANNTQRLLNVELRGANDNWNQVTTAGYFSSTKTGINNTNRAITAIVDSGVNNVAVYAIAPQTQNSYCGYFYGGDFFANFVRMAVNPNNNATLVGELNGLHITTKNDKDILLYTGGNTGYVAVTDRFAVSSSNGDGAFLKFSPFLIQTTRPYMDLNIGVNNDYTLRIKAPDGKIGIGYNIPTPPEMLSVNGNVALLTPGNKLKVATGSNASIGTATLSSGTITVNTTAVSSSSIIIVNYNSPSGTLGSGLAAPTGSIVNATSFVIRSLTSSGTTNTSDNSTVNWWIIN
ncbi:hypothetical protein LZZ85_27770 [Terrimonas sp. NA20]|uniref:K1 capsule-specific polysaccharide lyase C-terminal domain-containing protein n=1 Tax=Terrimonas ginsenosidimutans TaxID=2908004 RepID=A0ABS9L0U9_9BACT|nr:hypothetical protein [Terrimonas ginsenosidimutans]MCG2618133.1 hypothetical protein [Terrimonas ginsenosidimutans]